MCIFLSWGKNTSLTRCVFSNGKLVRTGEEFWFPDDVTLGYIIEHLLGVKLTQVPQFHSHLEPMNSVDNLDEQISLSYNEDNVINLVGPFSTEVDPTRYSFFICVDYLINDRGSSFVHSDMPVSMSLFLAVFEAMSHKDNLKKSCHCIYCKIMHFLCCLC